MTSKQWYYAQLRWAVMVEGKEGLREWKEAVHIFRSEDVQTAFQQALHIGGLGEDVHTEGRREVATRLAEVVRLDCAWAATKLSSRSGSVQATSANACPSIMSSNRRSTCPNRPFNAA